MNVENIRQTSRDCLTGTFENIKSSLEIEDIFQIPETAKCEDHFEDCGDPCWHCPHHFSETKITQRAEQNWFGSSLKSHLSVIPLVAGYSLFEHLQKGNSWHTSTDAKKWITQTRVTWSEYRNTQVFSPG